MFSFDDGISIQTWSFDFWDCVFSGKLNQFYTYLYENVRGARHISCGGSFFWLIPIAIWNLPLWIANKLIWGYMVLPELFGLWTKFFFLACMIALCSVIARIIEAGTEDKLDVMQFLIASPAITISSFYAGQDEVVYELFFFISLLLLKEKKYKKAYAFGLISVLMCPVLTPAFLLCLIAIEKNLWRVMLNLIPYFLVSALYQLFFRADEMLNYVNVSATGWIQIMFRYWMIQTPMGDLPIWALVYTILCWYVYKKCFLLSEENKNYIILLVSVSVSVITLIFMSNQVFYRQMLWVPFVLLLVMIEKEQKNLMYPLMVAITGGNFFHILSMDNYVFNYTCTSSLLKSIINKNIKYNNLFSALDEQYQTIEGLVLPFTIITYSALGLLFISIVSRDKKNYSLRGGAEVAKVVYSMIIPLTIILFVLNYA
jgi:hypothetical protein